MFTNYFKFCEYAMEQTVRDGWSITILGCRIVKLLWAEICEGLNFFKFFFFGGQNLLENSTGMDSLADR